MKNIIHAFFLAITLTGGASLVASPEPYAAIRSVSYEPYFFENSYILLNKVNAQSTTVFLDIESPDGMAARFIASNAPETVKVYNLNSWKDNEHDFQKFLSNVIHENNDTKIIPLRMSSKEGSGALNLISELIYIDCTEQAAITEKILSWVAHLSQNGVIAGNKWEWPEVQLAVVSAAGDLGLALSIESNFWFLSKN